MGKNVTVMGKEKTKQELKKHAATIHCSNTLSLLQRKIANALLYHAYKEMMVKDEHEITVKQLCRLIGYQGNNHAVIKEALKELISTVIEWNVINDETGSEVWTASSVIASVSLKGPLCYYAYSHHMKMLLHSPSMFGKIDLVIQSHFRSSYGLALYENCIRYRGLPSTKWFEIDVFKKLMGVPSGKYNIFRDFKRRVLDKAIDEVNTYSDLVISSDFVKEGRKVKRIRFTLKERMKRPKLGFKQALSLTDSTREQLKSVFLLSDEQIEELSLDYAKEYIEEKLALIIESKPFKEGTIENLAGYLLSALKYDYKIKKPTLVHNTLLAETDHEEELNALKRVVEEVKSAYHGYRETRIMNYINSLDDEQKAVFFARFKEEMEDNVRLVLKLQGHKYTRENVYDSPQIKAHLRQFALRELDFLTLMPIEEFVAGLKDEQRAAWQKFKSYDPDFSVQIGGENSK